MGFSPEFQQKLFRVFAFFTPDGDNTMACDKSISGLYIRAGTRFMINYRLSIVFVWTEICFEWQRVSFEEYPSSIIISVDFFYDAVIFTVSRNINSDSVYSR